MECSQSHVPVRDMHTGIESLNNPILRYYVLTYVCVYKKILCFLFQQGNQNSFQNYVWQDGVVIQESGLVHVFIVFQD